jgi:hypothetical protein
MRGRARFETNGVGHGQTHSANPNWSDEPFDRRLASARLNAPAACGWKDDCQKRGDVENRSNHGIPAFSDGVEASMAERCGGDSNCAEFFKI